MDGVRYEVRFVGHVGHYGVFETTAEARLCAKCECDGNAFTVHRITSEPRTR